MQVSNPNFTDLRNVTVSSTYTITITIVAIFMNVLLFLVTMLAMCMLNLFKELARTFVYRLSDYIRITSVLPKLC